MRRKGTARRGRVYMEAGRGGGGEVHVTASGGEGARGGSSPGREGAATASGAAGPRLPRRTGRNGTESGWLAIAFGTKVSIHV